jgi:hypothetical protein
VFSVLFQAQGTLSFCSAEWNVINLCGTAITVRTSCSQANVTSQRASSFVASAWFWRPLFRLFGIRASARKIAARASETSVNWHRNTPCHAPDSSTHQAVISSLMLLMNIDEDDPSCKESYLFSGSARSETGLWMAYIVTGKFGGFPRSLYFDPRYDLKLYHNGTFNKNRTSSLTLFQE